MADRVIGTGRFARGNKAGHQFESGAKARPGPGNPFGGAQEKFRAALFRTATRKSFDKIARKLFEAAENGSLSAISEVLDRLVGKPAQTVSVTNTTIVNQQTSETLAIMIGDPDLLRHSNEFARRLAEMTNKAGAVTEGNPAEPKLALEHQQVEVYNAESGNMGQDHPQGSEAERQDTLPAIEADGSRGKRTESFYGPESDNDD